jgi:glycosyltransferase involved in cell wall biosynthesis
MMPAKNTEQFIKDAIESIINQSYKNWELIIVDDQSSDRTFQIAESFAEKDPRIFVLHGDGAGAGRARNMAIAHSSGDYIANMDSDDVAAQLRIEKQVSLAKKHALSVICTNIGYTTKSLKIKKLSKLPITNKNIRKGFLRRINRLTIMPQTMMASAELLRKYRYNEFALLQDWDLILRISENQNVYFENTPEALYYYRLNNGSASYNLFLRNRYNILIRYNEKCRKNGKPETASLVEFENVMKKNALNFIVYNAFLLLKFVQRSSWIITLRLLLRE